jgi:hypothetical protein
MSYTAFRISGGRVVRKEGAPGSAGLEMAFGIWVKAAIAQASVGALNERRGSRMCFASDGGLRFAKLWRCSGSVVAAVCVWDQRSGLT